MIMDSDDLEQEEDLEGMVQSVIDKLLVTSD